MSKKKKRSPDQGNPVIEKAKKEAYEAGLKVGYRHGYASGEVGGVNKAIAFFMDKLDGLEKVKGIGPKIVTKIKTQIGDHYFAGDENETDKIV